MIKSLIRIPKRSSVAAPKDVGRVTVSIRFTPDESTQEAMRRFEVENYSKKIDSISKMISGHKLIRF